MSSTLLIDPALLIEPDDPGGAAGSSKNSRALTTTYSPAVRTLGFDERNDDWDEIMTRVEEEHFPEVKRDFPQLKWTSDCLTHAWSPLRRTGPNSDNDSSGRGELLGSMTNPLLDVHGQHDPAAALAAADTLNRSNLAEDVPAPPESNIEGIGPLLPLSGLPAIRGHCDVCGADIREEDRGFVVALSKLLATTVLIEYLAATCVRYTLLRCLDAIRATRNSKRMLL
jgi:hypothetical protein